MGLASSGTPNKVARTLGLGLAIVKELVIAHGGRLGAAKIGEIRVKDLYSISRRATRRFPHLAHMRGNVAARLPIRLSHLLDCSSLNGRSEAAEKTK
jgi:hypothetical protein